MEKIATLDQKISVELDTLHQKMESMQQEMTAFDDLEGLRRSAAESKAYLQEQMESYRKRVRDSREMVASMRREYETVKKELEDNETYKDLEDMENRMRKYAQTIFQLEEYIAAKSKESMLSVFRIAHEKLFRSSL